MNKIDMWLNAIITEDGHKLSVGSLRTIEMIRREFAQQQNNGKPHVSSSGGEMFKINCEHCKTETMQSVELYNPDNPDEGEVWQCSVCKENTDWVST